jgi:hypothetical protein
LPAFAFADEPYPNSSQVLQNESSLIQSITKVTLRQNRDGKGTTWFHPRVCMRPASDGQPIALMTLQEISGSDYFGPVHWSESRDASPQERWVTVGEWLPKRSARGDLLLARIRWSPPEKLPLKTDEWNRVRLSITGQTASLELNQVLVYQRELERRNQRTFGLFHDADPSELLVRNPSCAVTGRRRYGGPRAGIVGVGRHNEVEPNLAKLAKVFHHDFPTDGLADECLRHPNTDARGRVSLTGGS